MNKPRQEKQSSGATPEAERRKDVYFLILFLLLLVVACEVPPCLTNIKQSTVGDTGDSESLMTPESEGVG
jgi:hypothetical protein